LHYAIIPGQYYLFLAHSHLILADTRIYLSRSGALYWPWTIFSPKEYRLPLNEEMKSTSLVLANNPRYQPTVVSGILFLMLLLFIKDLPESLKTYTLPSLLMYTVFTAVVGFIHSYFYHVNLYARFEKKGQHKRYKLECWEIWLVIILHILSFVFLIFYNVYRSVL
jgi:hypothetical protein